MEELETERAALANKIQAEGMNDEQILTLVAFTQQMAADWEEISQSFEKRRAVIDYLDIRITLMLTPERQCKGILTGLLPGGPREFWIDDSRSGMTGMPPANLEHLRIRRGGPMCRSSKDFYPQPLPLNCLSKLRLEEMIQSYPPRSNPKSLNLSGYYGVLFSKT